MRLACYSGTAYRNACNLIKMSCLAQPATFGNNSVLTKWINETLTLHDPLGNHSFRFLVNRDNISSVFHSVSYLRAIL